MKSSPIPSTLYDFGLSPERIEPSGSAPVLPDFRTGRQRMDQRIVRIVKLIGMPRIGNFARQPVGDAVVTLWRIRWYIGCGDNHLGAIGLEQCDLVFAHLVGQDHDHAVALDCGRDGETDAGVAGRGLDDGAAGLDLVRALGGLNHGHANAVLDAAAGIQHLGLHVDRRRDI
jgi:hypothetical protein